MSDKGDYHRTYEIHGDGLESIWRGFAELGMPQGRQAEAFAIVSEVVEANRAAGFRWYKTPGTNELACYWDGATVNMLWITAGEAHIAADTARPERALTWSKQDGAYVGWLLPGADGGTGGGPKKVEVAKVLCPVTYLWQPAGQPCLECEVVHT